MKIVFLGAGNLATHLARACQNAGFEIIQVFSRSEESARSLANTLHATHTTQVEEIYPYADLYLFSVTDTALPKLICRMPKTSGVWAHTAGSVPMSVFDGHHSQFGVLYPLQTFSKSRAVDFNEIPIFVEANNPNTENILLEFSKKISLKTQILSSEKRRYLHLCAVFASNLVNHLYHISETILTEQNIPFEVLLPLIDETARKVHSLPPSEAQTGPAVRGDQDVMNAHLHLLTNTHWQEIYRILSEGIERVKVHPQFTPKTKPEKQTRSLNPHK